MSLMAKYYTSAAGINVNYCLLLSGWKSRDEVPKLVNDYLDKKLKVDEFITCTETLEDINIAFDLMRKGKRYAIAMLLT